MYVIVLISIYYVLLDCHYDQTHHFIVIISFFICSKFIDLTVVGRTYINKSRDVFFDVN